MDPEDVLIPVVFSAPGREAISIDVLWRLDRAQAAWTPFFRKTPTDDSASDGFPWSKSSAVVWADPTTGKRDFDPLADFTEFDTIVQAICELAPATSEPFLAPVLESLLRAPGPLALSFPAHPGLPQLCVPIRVEPTLFRPNNQDRYAASARIDIEPLPEHLLRAHLALAESFEILAATHTPPSAACGHPSLRI